MMMRRLGRMAPPWIRLTSSSDCLVRLAPHQGAVRAIAAEANAAPNSDALTEGVSAYASSGANPSSVSSAPLFVPHFASNSYQRVLAGGSVSLQDLAESPYAPHTSVVLRDVATNVAREASKLADQMTDSDIIATADRLVNGGDTVGDPDDERRGVRAASGQSLVLARLVPSEAFRVSRDAALKAQTAAAAFAATDAADDFDRLQAERQEFFKLDKALFVDLGDANKADAATTQQQRQPAIDGILRNVERRLTELEDRLWRDDEGAAAHAFAVRELQVAIALWTGELLQGHLAMAGELGEWGSALMSLTALRRVDDWVSRLAARSAAREEDADGALTCNAPNFDNAAVRRWAFHTRSQLSERSERAASLQPATLSRAVKACSANRQFDVAFQLCQDALQAALTRAVAAQPDAPLSSEQRREIVQHCLTTATLTSLAGCIDSRKHLTDFRQLFIDSASSNGALSHIPVSGALYTALIDACAIATDEPARLTMALGFYRTLRDTGIAPTPATYGALTRVAASVGKVDTALGFLHEARLMAASGAATDGGAPPAVLPPSVYAGVLQAFAKAGYGTDAFQSLETLVESGVPLTRPAFHAALTKVNFDDAMTVIGWMTGAGYNIAATPATYALAMRSVSRARGMPRVDRLLCVGDLHAKVLTAVEQRVEVERVVRQPLLDGGTADGAAGGSAGVEPATTAPTAAAGRFVVESITRQPATTALSKSVRQSLRGEWSYVATLLRTLVLSRPPLPVALVILAGPRDDSGTSDATAIAASDSADQLRGDDAPVKNHKKNKKSRSRSKSPFGMDASHVRLLANHLKPVTATARDVLAFLDSPGSLLHRVAEPDEPAGLPAANLAPQRPTRLPHRPVIAVVAGDVLCDGVFEAIAPVMRQFSAIVIPAASLVHLAEFVQENGHKVDLHERERARQQQASRAEPREEQFATDETPEARAAAAVTSLRRLLYVFGDAVHIGGIEEQMVASSFMDRFALTRHHGDPQKRPYRRTQHDFRSALGMRAVAAAGALVHPGASDEMARVRRALGQEGLVVAPAADPGGGDGGLFSMYRQAASRVVFLTRDPTLRHRASALGRTIRDLYREQADVDTASRVAAVPGAGAFSLLACATASAGSQAAPTRRASVEAPPVPELRALNPDYWPEWMLPPETNESTRGAVSSDASKHEATLAGSAAAARVRRARSPASHDDDSSPPQPESFAAKAFEQAMAGADEALLHELLMLDDDHDAA